MSSCVLLVLLALLARPGCAQVVEVPVLLPGPAYLPVFAAYTIAEKKGFYQQEGVQVRLVEVAGWEAVLQGLAEGTGLLGHGLLDQAVIARAHGASVKVVARLSGHGVFFIAALERQGIRDLKDLKGKTVAVGQASGPAAQAFQAALVHVGLKKDDVTLEAAGGNVPRVVDSGQAHALVGAIEWGITLEDRGRKVTWIPLERYLPAGDLALLASDAALRDRPEVVGKVVRATLRGLAHLVASQNDAAEIYVKAHATTQKAPREYKRVFQRYVTWVYFGQKALGDVPLESLRRLQDAYADVGIITTKAAVADLYNDRFVRAAPARR